MIITTSNLPTAPASRSNSSAHSQPYPSNQRAWAYRMQRCGSACPIFGQCLSWASSHFHSGTNSVFLPLKSSFPSWSYVITSRLSHSSSFDAFRDIGPEVPSWKNCNDSIFSHSLYYNTWIVKILCVMMQENVSTSKSMVFWPDLQDVGIAVYPVDPVNPV